MLVITCMFTDRTGLHLVLFEQPRTEDALLCPTTKAREKRPGDEVAIGITYKTIIAKKKQQQRMLLCLRLTMYLKCAEIGFAIEVLWSSDLQ